MKTLSEPEHKHSTGQGIEQHALFLPDFCSLKVVFSIVIIAELLAFILTLAPLNMEQQRWNDLALISLFIQWNGLMCSTMLCVLRPLLRSRSNQFIAFTSYLSLLLMITFISELTFYILQQYHISDIIASATHWEFLSHNLFIGAIISALALRYFYIQHQWRIKIQAESNTRLQLLQARIRPHFLFNSMNSIASLTRSQPQVAERVTEDLAELFRMLFRDEHELICWRREKELSQRYIDIEKQRLGERLMIQWHIDDVPDDAMLPALLLQPLLENAIFHGIEPEIKGGQIIVSGTLHHQQLSLTVQNSNSDNMAHRQGNKLALDNIEQRLHAHFNGDASIVCAQRGDYYFAIVTMPYQKKQNG